MGATGELSSKHRLRLESVVVCTIVLIAQDD